MSPKILLEKNKEREKRQSEEKERKRRKKSNGCTLSFYVSSAKDLFMGPGTTILDRVKWNSKPPSPQIKDEAALKPKRTIFLSLIQGGSGVQIFHLLFCQRLQPVPGAQTDVPPPFFLREGGLLYTGYSDTGEPK